MQQDNSDSLITVQLRKDQSGTNSVPEVNIYAPQWVHEVFEEKIKEELIGVQVRYPKSDEDDNPNEPIVLDHDNLTLGRLVGLARNESINTKGEINYKLFRGIPKKTVMAIKDLVKNVIIIAPTKAVAYFDNESDHQEYEEAIDAIIIDLIGLEFLQNENTGRLVTINDNFPKGLLDDEIFEHVVGQRKLELKQVKLVWEAGHETAKARYVKIDNDTFFDTYAYAMFVRQDFLLCANALLKTVDLTQVDTLTFKFLKYGNAHFQVKKLIEENIYQGIYLALLDLAGEDKNLSGYFNTLELPFSQESDNPIYLKKIQDICAENHIELKLSTNDPLYKEPDNPGPIAVTNCANPHTPAGNGMNHSSVDASIAENLANKANQFNPNLNQILFDRKHCKAIKISPVKHTDALNTDTKAWARSQENNRPSAQQLFKPGGGSGDETTDPAELSGIYCEPSSSEGSGSPQFCKCCSIS